MPDLLISSIVFVIGLVMLSKGADFFVEAAAKIAKILGVSEFIISLTLIAVGTSLPELGAGIVASYSGQTEIVLGNVLGSNIANIALILGISALITPLVTKKEMFYRDGYALLLVSSLFYYTAYDGTIDPLEGAALVTVFFTYTAILLKFKPRIPELKEYANIFYDLDRITRIQRQARLLRKGGGITAHMDFLKMYISQLRRLLRTGKSIGTFPIKMLDHRKRGDYIRKVRGYRERLSRVKEYRERLRESLIRDLGILLVSCAAIYLGAEFFVGSAIDIATAIGVGPSVIGLTIVSIGTSLPEFAVSLQSLRKGFNQMVIGNIIGSNISNITLIIGICALISPVSLGINEELRHVNEYNIIPFMIFVSLLGVIFIRTGWSIRRFEGILLLLIYSGFLFWLMNCPGIIR